MQLGSTVICGSEQFDIMGENIKSRIYFKHNPFTSKILTTDFSNICLARVIIHAVSMLLTELPRICRRLLALTTPLFYLHPPYKQAMAQFHPTTGLLSLG